MKILHKITAAVLWESPCSTMRETVEKAIAAKADLRYADLTSADLRYADLRYADLRYADLTSANLRYADLRYANLRSADLTSAKNTEIAIAVTRILPAGELVGWKKARCEDGFCIVELTIPKTAKRSHAFGRKCRASAAKVIKIHYAKEAWSDYDSGFRYKVGKVLKPTEPFDEDFTKECASGIHFFITRLEAENYSL